MLAAVADAKAAAKDSTGHGKRLESINASLLGFVVDIVEGLLGETCNDEQIELKGGQVRDALDKVLRRATQATSEISEANAIATRKQLKDKDKWWKLKLETVRLSIPGQLRNQATELKLAHAQQLMDRMQDLREHLTQELSSPDGVETALRESIMKMETQKAMLETKVGLLEAGIRTLQDDIEGTRAELGRTSEELTILQSANIELSKRLIPTTKRVTELEIELAKLQQEARERTARLEEELVESSAFATQQMGQLEEQLRERKLSRERFQEQSQGQIESLVSELALVRQQLQAAQQAACQSSASSAKLEQYEANIATLREECGSLLREKETANALQARLQEEMIAIQTAWQDANAKVERLQTSLENVRATVRQECEAQSSTELATVKELLATSEATGTRLKQELLQVRGELTKVKGELAKVSEASEAKLSRLEKELSTFRNGEKGAEKELSACRAKLALRLVDLGKAHNELSEKRALENLLTEQVKQLSEKSAVLLAERDVLQKERGKLAAGLEMASKAVEAAAQATLSKNRDLMTCSEELAELRSAYRAVVEQRDRERDKCRKALQKVEHHIAKELELDHMLENLVARYKIVSEAHHKATTELLQATFALESSTRASKQEREKLVRISLESLTSLKRHLLTTLGIADGSTLGITEASSSLLDVRSIYRTASLPSIATKGTTSSMIRDAFPNHQQQHPSRIVGVPDENGKLFDDGFWQQRAFRKSPTKLVTAFTGSPARADAASLHEEQGYH
jgi:chromosome segregation ATPase